jgi:Spy/CpxP family protein refolding chaperone
MRTVIMLATAGALAFPLAVVAQERHIEVHDFADHLFPPELVMRHQRTLDLTDEQRSTIREHVRELQAQVLDLQWQLEDQQQALGELLAQDTIDEVAALQQMDQVLQLEQQIKRNHFRLLVDIKNTLTAEQKQKLLYLVQQEGQHREVQHEMTERLRHMERVRHFEQQERAGLRRPIER